MKLPVEILQELGPLAKPKAPKQTIHTRKQSVNSRKQKTVKKTNDSEKIAKLKKSNPALFNLLQEQDLIPNAPPEKTKITELETKLGIKDSKLTQDFMDDGLDFLLDGILDTSEKTPQIPPKPPQVDKTVPQINTKHPSNNLAPKIDIYGQGTSQPYVPPHLRESQKGNQYSQLKRQIQGLLNKLGNSNIEYVLSQTQQFYQNNKRHDVTEIISDILQSFLVDSSVLNPSFITTYACYISLLHKITTLDFSSHFIQLTITKFTSLVAEQDKSSLCHKCINLIILFGNLYEFAVIGPTLIYDLVRLILKESTPTNVELLVKIFNVCGHKLRNEDPSSLKDIVSDANSTFSNQTNVRATFMLANLSDLKNNRKKIETSDLDRLKKLVMSISKNNLLFNEPLQVSLDDILSIETRGRWWVVGASYKQAEVPKMDEKTDLHQLAVKQKMNTDVRKSIFMVLLSSQDYIDATNQILKLGLRKGQQKEIIKVLIHCVQQESTYNYFYTLVVAQFIDYDPEFAYTYQFCLWDTYKLLDDLKKAAKLAQMTSDLIVDSKLPFGALKGLEINVPTKAQKRFLVILTVNVLKKFDLNIFSRMSGMIDFRDSYLTFLEQNKPVFANLVGAKELLNFKTLCQLLDDST